MKIGHWRNIQQVDPPLINKLESKHAVIDRKTRCPQTEDDLALMSVSPPNTTRPIQRHTPHPNTHHTPAPALLYANTRFVCTSSGSGLMSLLQQQTQRLCLAVELMIRSRNYRRRAVQKHILRFIGFNALSYPFPDIKRLKC